MEQNHNLSSEIADKADFSAVRYAQCWEDADILLEALNMGPESVCLSIASAGDNSFSMISQSPAIVTAIDLNPAQLACVALRKAAYRNLNYGEFMNFFFSGEYDERHELLERCRPDLEPAVYSFWKENREALSKGFGHAGKFEHYFEVFRKGIIPLVHNRNRITEVLRQKPLLERLEFYHDEWDSWRWRLLFKIFFSRFIMGRMGRDPEFFRYVEGSVAENILKRTRYVLTELDTSKNPYLQWILLGQFKTAFPHAMREENYSLIRNNLDRLEPRLQSMESYLEVCGENAVDCFNLSDIFEYMSEENYRTFLEKIVRAAKPGARLVYWNMLVPRQRPESMSSVINPLPELSSRLFREDKAWFYSRFVVEEVVK